jgi:hypothetical protein
MMVTHGGAFSREIFPPHFSITVSPSKNHDVHDYPVTDLYRRSIGISALRRPTFYNMTTEFVTQYAGWVYLQVAVTIGS